MKNSFDLLLKKSSKSRFTQKREKFYEREQRLAAERIRKRVSREAETSPNRENRLQVDRVRHLNHRISRTVDADLRMAVFNYNSEFDYR